MTLNVAFGSIIETAARRHGLDPRLLAAVAAQETGGPQADSGRNVLGDGGHGHGIFQIDDRSHPFARSVAAMDPVANADYAAGLLSGLQRRFGDVRQALSAYNAGDPHARGTVTDWGDGGKPLGYADSVLRHYARLGGQAPGPTERDRAQAPDGAAGPNASLDELGISAGWRLSALAALGESMSALTSAATVAPPDPPQPSTRSNLSFGDRADADSDT